MTWSPGLLGFAAGLLISVATAPVGVAGGIYRIGGGSLLGPVLVGRGMPVAEVAPAAPAATFVTSAVGGLHAVQLLR